MGTNLIPWCLLRNALYTHLAQHHSDQSHSRVLCHSLNLHAPLPQPQRLIPNLPLCQKILSTCQKEESMRRYCEIGNPGKLETCLGPTIPSALRWWRWGLVVWGDNQPQPYADFLLTRRLLLSWGFSNYYWTSNLDLAHPHTIHFNVHMHVALIVHHTCYLAATCKY